MLTAVVVYDRELPTKDQNMPDLIMLTAAVVGKNYQQTIKI